MNAIARFFDELKHPEKKCARIGHDRKIRMRRGYASTWKWEELEKETLYRAVAMKTTERQQICGRCGYELSEKSYSRDGALNGLTLNSEDFETMRHTGFYFSEEIVMAFKAGGA